MVTFIKFVVEQPRQGVGKLFALLFKSSWRPKEGSTSKCHNFVLLLLLKGGVPYIELNSTILKYTASPCVNLTRNY